MNTVKLLKIAVAQTEHDTEFFVAGKTPGIAPCDVQEVMNRVAVFEPPRDGRMNMLNLYCHHLPGGGTVIGRMVPETRGTCISGYDAQVHLNIQCLIVEPQTFRDFGCNPVVLYQTILGQGALSAFLTSNERLPPIMFKNGNSSFDRELVRGLAVNPGVDALSVMLESTLDSIETFFSGSVSGIHVLAGLFNLLPVAWRRELTFAVGFNFSDRFESREDVSFRLVGVPMDDETMIAWCKTRSLPYFDLNEISRRERKYDLVEGWALLVRQLLSDGQADFLIPHLTDFANAGDKTSTDETELPPATEEINRLGFRLLEEYREEQAELEKERQAREKTQTEQVENEKKKKLKPAQTDESDTTVAAPFERPDGIAGGPLDGAMDDTSEAQGPMQLETVVPYPGHSPQMLRHEEPLLRYDRGNRIFSPYQRLYAQWPEHRELFLRLDSLIAHVLNREPDAVPLLDKFWRKLPSKVNSTVLWAIREEYIHYVQASLTDEDQQSAQPMQKSLYTLEILELLVR